MLKILSYTLPLLFLSGCTSVDNQWLKTVEGNDLDITTGKNPSGSRFVNVENKLRTWNGAYQGGEEMLPARKKLFSRLAREEAKRVCAPDDYELIGSADYTMVERNADTYGGGLLGIIISNVAAQYENLPTAARYDFKCSHDK